jgi:hypothetical protein
MKTEVPAGFITVVETSEKNPKGGSRLALWDAVWQPKQNEAPSSIEQAKLRIRSVSKLSKDDAILRVKFKVCKHFGGEGWNSRTIPPSREPSVYLKNKPWGNGDPKESAPGSRTNINKPQPSIPNGQFKTTKHRITKYKGNEWTIVTEWRTTWTQGADQISGLSNRRFSRLVSVSQISAMQSRTACESKVRSHFMPKVYKKAQEDKVKVKKLQLLIDLNSLIVKIPSGQVRLIYSKGGDDAPSLRSYRWYPIGDAAIIALKLATKNTECEFLESTAGNGQIKRDFDQLRRKVLKTFSGKFQNKTWNDAMPQLDNSDKPWGVPISQWEEDIIPGLSPGELEGLQVIGESDYGLFKGLGVVYIWRPARELALGDRQSLPDIYSADHRYNHAYSVRCDAAKTDCIGKVASWLDEHLPNPAMRPSLGEPPSFDMEEYTQLLNSPITKHTDWVNPRIRRHARNQQRIFVNSQDAGTTDISQGPRFS